jgi:hypothetical protein
VGAACGINQYGSAGVKRNTFWALTCNLNDKCLGEASQCSQVLVLGLRQHYCAVADGQSPLTQGAASRKLQSQDDAFDAGKVLLVIPLIASWSMVTIAETATCTVLLLHVSSASTARGHCVRQYTQQQTHLQHGS